MTTTSEKLFVGLGSLHGDDRIGLCIAERLALNQIPGILVRAARTPSEMLAWFADAERLVVCDACQSQAPLGTVHQWNWPAEEIESTHFFGSHDLPLVAVLKLADRLGQLPRKVVIVGVSIEDCRPREGMSPELVAAIPHIVTYVRGVVESA